MKKTIFKIVFAVALVAGTASIASAQRTKEFFDKKGRHAFTIAYYGEKDLPYAVRAIVKPEYFDYTILTVEEVRLPERSVYFIDMEDATTLKTVKVVDGEMEEVKSYLRADLPVRTEGKRVDVRN